MNVATGFDHRAYSLREFVEKIRIVDRVHRVEAQAVEAIFVQPVQCVVNEELAYRPAPEVDRRAPRCMAIFGEEIRCVGMEVIAVRSEVVVDDIDEDHQTERVRRVDQLLEFIRRSEEHTSELQSLMRISYAVFCLKK